MSIWLHRTDKTVLERVSPSDMKLRFPTLVFIDGSGHAQSNATWIRNPDLTAVVGFKPKHWNIVGDGVSLMTQTERNTVDAQIAADELTADRDFQKVLYDTEKSLKALALIVMDELNILRALQSLPDRTPAQIKTPFQNKVDTL